jgi:predicted ATPase
MTADESSKLLKDRYRLSDPIGEGQMGMVYRGLDLSSGQTVAIKHLRPELIVTNPENLARFEREVEALGRLNHPNIIKLIDSVYDGEDYYLVLEYLDGGDLVGLLQTTGRLTITRALRLGIELADALTRAHHVQIIHRDIAPYNIMLTTDGSPKLTDFGVAQLQKKRVSRTGSKMGKADYLSPEALQGSELDARADIWSLGVVLFEMLTGRAPFTHANSLATTMLNIANQPTPDLEALREDIPPALADLIYRMLYKDREARIPSARLVGAEMELILQAIETGRHTPVPRPPTTRELRRFITPTPMPVANHNLPAHVTPFVGRERELEELTRLILDPQVRLITLMGPGGIGKTRLALAAAERLLPQFTDGAFWVNLAPLASPDSLVQTLGHTLNMDFAQDLDPKAQLLDYLREKNLLLVMDNWEHLLNGIGLLNDILLNARFVQVIATSRVKLNLQGETLFNTEGLDYPDYPRVADALQYSAVALFAQAARRVQPDYEITAEDLSEVVKICQMVEGMPLGIELAASWIEVLTVREIVHEMRGNLDFLETDSAGVLTRQRSMRAVFEYSWMLLSEEERTAFIRIAVFRGRFTRQAGQTVTGATMRQLMALANKSLLWRDADTGVYQIHEVSRQFAEEKLALSGEAEAVRDAHCTYYMQTLAAVRRDLEGRRQLQVLDEIEADLENFRSAWLWGAMRGMCADLHIGIYAFGLYFLLHGELMAGVDLFTETVRRLRLRPATAEREQMLGAALIWQAALILLSARDPRGAYPMLDEARAAITTHGDTFHRALLMFTLAYYELNYGDPVRARGLFEDSLHLYEAIGENYQVAMVYANWSRTYWYRLPHEQIDLVTAEELLAKAQTALGNEPGLYGYAYTLMNQSIVESMQKNPQSEAHAREALSMYRRLRNMFGVTSTLNSLTVIATGSGRIDDARRYAAENLRVRRDIGGEIGVVSALLGLTRVEIATSDYDRAIELMGEAATLALALGSERYQLEALVLRAEIEAIRGNIEQAASLAAYVTQSPQADPHQRGRSWSQLDRLRLWLDETTMKQIADFVAQTTLYEMMITTFTKA